MQHAATPRSGTRAKFVVKRVYATPDATDGTRVLVDALWPRGMSKSTAKVDVWLKEIAPSTALREWFHHDPERWDAFRRKYTMELADKMDAVAELRRLARTGRVTLLYGARDTDHNNAIVLQDFLSGPGKTRKPARSG